MKTNIKVTAFSLTPALEDYVKEKLAHLNKLLPADHNSIRADIELAKITEHHKQGEVYRAEIHLHVGGQDLYTSETAGTIFAAIDLVKDEMIHQLRTTNKKRLTLFKRGGRLLKQMLKGWYH